MENSCQVYRILSLVVFIQFVLSKPQIVNFRLPEVKQIGSECNTTFGDLGYCTRIAECPLGYFLLTVENVCSYEGENAIICCIGNRSDSLIETENPINNETSEVKFDERISIRKLKILNKIHNSNHIADKKCQELIEFQKHEKKCQETLIFDETELNCTKKNNLTRTLFKGGQFSPVANNPHMAGIGWKTFGNKTNWKCGGSLISEEHVLTAAHCVDDKDYWPDIVRIGESELSQYSFTVYGQDFKVTNITIHPCYSLDGLQHDIAIIQISPKAVFNLYVKPACLWTDPDLPVSELLGMGYGTDDFGGKKRNKLYEGNLNLIENNICKELMQASPSNVLYETQICAKDPNGIADTCQGDSGGPLLFRTEVDESIRAHHLVGITSYGQACGGPVPGVYTKISSYIDWIESVVWPEEMCNLNQ